MEAVGRRRPRPAVRLPVFPHSRAQSWGPGEVPELFPPLCAAAGLPGLRIGSLGPFSRIINSSLCPAWPIDQPRPPRGLQAPVLHLSSHPSEARPTPPPCRQRVPRSVADVPSPWQPACPRPARLRLREVGVWATEGEVQWPGHCSVLGLAGSLGGWGGILFPRNLTLLRGGGQRCLTPEGLAEGCRPRPLPVNWAQWVSLGLEARETSVQILHPHLLLRSP